MKNKIRQLARRHLPEAIRKPLGAAAGKFDETVVAPVQGLIFDLLVRRFRPVGIWREQEREFVFLIGCEKSGALYTPQNAFGLALGYKAKFERGEGGTSEHY